QRGGFFYARERPASTSHNGTTMLKSKPAHLGSPKSNGSGPARAKRELMRIAFQGDRGAYGESAIADIWRHPVEHLPMPTFAAVVRAVITGDADACVIPVEN